MLDFGAVNRLPDGLPPAMGRLLTMALDGDAEDVLGRPARARVSSSPRIEIDAEAPAGVPRPLPVDPLHTDTFTFSRAWLRGLFAHINDPRRPQFTVGLKLNLPPEYLLIHRVWLGGIGVLCQIEGTVAGRATISAWMPHAKLPQLDV